MFFKYLNRVIGHNYRLHWRSRFVQLFDATGATQQELVFVSSQLMEANERFSGAITWIVELLYEDVGLLMYSLATPYRR